MLLLGQLPYLQAMGADPMIRGPYTLWDYESDTCTSRESIRGNIKTVTFETPVGSLTEEYTYSEGGDTWFLTGHPVETEEDFKVLQYIYEHMTLKENLAGFEQDYKDMGQQGLIVLLIGTNRKTSFQGLVEHWVGTVNLSYALMDFPEVVEECLAVMRQRDLESVRIAAKSSAEVFIFWEDSSTTNISPDMFEKYTLPVIREWGDVLHENGKLLIHHAWTTHINTYLTLVAELLIGIPLSLLLALIMDRSKPMARNLFKLVALFPSMLSVAVVGKMFQGIFATDWGVFNAILRALGLDALCHSWLSDPGTAKYCVTAAFIWQYLGYNAIIFYTGIKGIPGEYYEAATLDGANFLQTSWHITFPLLQNVFKFIQTGATTGTLSMYGLISVMTNGGPGRATRTVLFEMSYQAFSVGKFGYGSAIAMLFLVECVFWAFLINHFVAREKIIY